MRHESPRNLWQPIGAALCTHATDDDDDENDLFSFLRRISAPPPIDMPSLVLRNRRVLALLPFLSPSSRYALDIFPLRPRLVDMLECLLRPLVDTFRKCVNDRSLMTRGQSRDHRSVPIPFRKAPTRNGTAFRNSMPRSIGFKCQHLGGQDIGRKIPTTVSSLFFLLLFLGFF